MRFAVVVFLFSLLWACFWATILKGNDLRYLELERCGFEFSHLADNQDPYYQYPKHGSCSGCEYWKARVAVVFDVDVLSYRGKGIYFRNNVFGDATNVQFRTVGWQYRVGVHLGVFDIFHEHVSRHVLDTDRDDRFPLFNSYGVRLNLYERGK